jgi:protocatechuate 3,4-dioxygenase beta subunit
MKYPRLAAAPAALALMLLALDPSSSLVAQGQRQGGAGGQGGGFGQGAGGGRPGQVPPRDPAGTANGTGDQVAGTAIIRGRVVSPEGTPVRRAQVRAQSGELRANRLASTDAQGRFEFKDLPGGRWNLTASKAGFMTLRYGQRRAFEAGSPIDISDGQVVERADFSLPRGAAITGRVFDEFGDPVANARVQVMRYQMVQGTRRLTPSGGGDQSDDTGAYRIYGLPPGDYYVSATLRAGNGPFVDDQNDATSYAATYYPGTGNVAEAQRMTLGIGQEQPNVNFALQPVRTVKISGMALDSSGNALTNGMVNLLPADGAGIGGGAVVFGFGGNGRVRADGSFTIANVSPGTYTLMAVAGPGGGRGGGGFAFRIGGGPGAAGGPLGPMDIEFASMPLVVSSDDLTGLTLVTSKGASISGNVVAAEGSVAKLSTNAITIVGQGAQFQPGPFQNRPAQVDADGNFVLFNLTGQKFIRVNGLPAEWTLKAVTFNGVDVTDSALEFRGSAQTSGLQVVVTDKVSDLNGKVMTAKGDVTRDYTVVVFPDDPAKWAFPSRFVKTARADQQGQFRIKALPAHDRYLAVAVDYLEDGEGGDPQFLEQIKDRATRFALSDGESKAIDLKLVNR